MLRITEVIYNSNEIIAKVDDDNVITKVLLKTVPGYRFVGRRYTKKGTANYVSCVPGIEWEARFAPKQEWHDTGSLAERLDAMLMRMSLRGYDKAIEEMGCMLDRDNLSNYIANSYPCSGESEFYQEIE